jgi:hypothetical protein
MSIRHTFAETLVETTVALEVIDGATNQETSCVSTARD